MNYDLLTTICGVIVAVSGVIALDEQHVFSTQVQVVAKCIGIAATALGLYFANKKETPKVFVPKVEDPLDAPHA